jgi:hypothetical protein
MARTGTSWPTPVVVVAVSSHLTFCPSDGSANSSNASKGKVTLTSLSRCLKLDSIVMTLIAGVLFAMAVALSITEAVVEKDWPSHTFRFVLIFGTLFFIWLSL